VLGAAVFKARISTIEWLDDVTSLTMVTPTTRSNRAAAQRPTFAG
jgi:hypothetical protein